MKRAAIYIRVSSEGQYRKKQTNGDDFEEILKASAVEQENDCLKYCETHGYSVYKVFKDVERYRVNRRLVEPSATRSDRPGLRQMIADADEGYFDVIVAWREDRLYRGINLAMLDINDRVKRKLIEVELVKEYFDTTLAGAKAWAAGIELEAKHDRLMMGVASRFREGLDWNGHVPYGYKYVDGRYEIDDLEAEWVNKIFSWFADGETGGNIRKKLVAGNAPQKDGIKVPWPIQRIYQMLKKEHYWTGILYRNWDGEVYELSLPVIISDDLARKVKERLERWKKYPAGHLKEKALAAGLLYCVGCNVRMRVRRNPESIFYSCARIIAVAGNSPACSGTRSIRLLDAELWNRVWGLISVPGVFENAIDERIRMLQGQEGNAKSDCERLERQLESILQERQRVTTWARKMIITEGDLKNQLLELTSFENAIRRELREKRILAGSHADRLLEIAKVFREYVAAGYEGLNREPINSEDQDRQFKVKRKIVESLVKRIYLLADKTISVEFEIDEEKFISISPAGRRW